VTKKEQAQTNLQTTQLQTMKQSQLLRNRAAQAVFERKVWAECRNDEETWGESPHTTYGRVRFARFAREDFGCGGSCLPNREEETTVLQCNTAGVVLSSIICTKSNKGLACNILCPHCRPTMLLGINFICHFKKTSGSGLSLIS